VLQIFLVPKHSGYIKQPQKLPNFPFLKAIGFPQSGQSGATAFFLATEQEEQTGAPCAFSFVAGFPQKEHFPTISKKKNKTFFFLWEKKPFFSKKGLEKNSNCFFKKMKKNKHPHRN